MASLTPKLSEILSPTDLMLWLGETIQEKAGKENNGLVQIQVVRPTVANPHHQIVLTSPRTPKIVHRITITTERVS